MCQAWPSQVRMPLWNELPSQKIHSCREPARSMGAPFLDAVVPLGSRTAVMLYWVAVRTVGPIDCANPMPTQRVGTEVRGSGSVPVPTLPTTRNGAGEPVGTVVHDAASRVRMLAGWVVVVVAGAVDVVAPLVGVGCALLVDELPEWVMRYPTPNGAANVTTNNTVPAARRTGGSFACKRRSARRVAVVA